MEKYFDKLVRDNIPEIIRENGQEAVYRILDDKEYIERLNQKLLEEVNEYIELNCLNEICDILEVLEALCEAMGISQEDLKLAKSKKAAKNGAFKKRILLEKVIT